MADQHTEIREVGSYRVAHRPQDDCEGARATTPLTPFLHALVADPHIADRGNSPVRSQVMLQVQQTHGNRAVQRFLGPTSTMPTASKVSVQRRPLDDVSWPADERRRLSAEESRSDLGAVIDTLGGLVGGPAVGTPSWLQTLNRHATGFEQTPFEEARSTTTTDIVGAIPGPIGTVAGVAALGHDVINAIVAPALGDQEEARRARHDIALDAAGLLPGGDFLGLVQLAVDGGIMQKRFDVGSRPGGNPYIPGVAESTRRQYPLSGDLWDRALTGAWDFARDVFTAPPIVD